MPCRQSRMTSRMWCRSSPKPSALNSCKGWLRSWTKMAVRQSNSISPHNGGFFFCDRNLNSPPPFRMWLCRAASRTACRKSDIALNRYAVGFVGNGDASRLHHALLLIQLLHPMLLVIDDGRCEGQGTMRPDMRQRDEDCVSSFLGEDMTDDTALIARI